MKLTLFGATGKMGQAVTRLAAAAEDVTIVGAVDHHDSARLGQDIGEVAGVQTVGVAISADLGSALLGADVLIDFSNASAFDEMLRRAARAGVAVVSGSTGLSAESEALIDKVAERIAVLWAPNMSLGVQVLAQLLRSAMLTLGADYDVEIVEAHHNRKIDSPSGTATFLCETAEGVRPLQRAHGREGQVGARTSSEIGVHAIRGGGIIGDHTAHLIGEHDRIEITHRAIGRDLFAAGALRAARFVAGRSAGRYQLSELAVV